MKDCLIRRPAGDAEGGTVVLTFAIEIPMEEAHKLDAVLGC